MKRVRRKTLRSLGHLAVNKFVIACPASFKTLVLLLLFFFGIGYYMYIETSYPRNAGDNARLELSVSGNGEPSCLEFYYHMYGYTMGTLTVLSGNVTVFKASGNHGQIWIQQKSSINLTKTVSSVH